LVGGEPVAQPDANPTHALHATNAGCEFRTEQPGIGRFMGHAAHGGQPQVDRGRRVVPLIQVNAIAEDHRPVEREPGLGAVPRDELSNRVVVGPLTAGRRETGEHGTFRLFEVRKREHPLGRLLPSG
jgi:hypothetical protein